jgi:3',5'-cyclic AMP phosphodiesterase CpdA
VSAPKDDDAFDPVLRFVIASDTHIEAIGDVRCHRIQKILSLAYNDARQNKSYQKLDAAVFAGDVTDDGRYDEYVGFRAAVESALKKGETKFLAVLAAKSHDGKAHGKEALSVYESLSGMDSDFHEVINGFHFIGLSSSVNPDDLYSDYQRDWLREQLDAAVADDPDKPIFVTHHEHVRDTVYGSTDEDGWGVDYFKDIFEQYPQIIHFSGHSHYPLNDPRSIWQGAFTALGTGAVYYAELTVDGENCVHPEHNHRIAQAWIVEVNARNEVRLRGFDALSGTMLCKYTLRDIANASTRAYTPQQQKDASSAPAFAQDAAIRVRKTLGGKVKVTVPAAESTDGNIIFIYRITVMDASGSIVDEQKLVNDYWLANSYKQIGFTVEADSGCTVCVIAENAYGMQSEPLTARVG